MSKSNVNSQFYKMTEQTKTKTKLKVCYLSMSAFIFSTEITLDTN